MTSIAIAKNICKANYQKGFLLYVFDITLGRFVVIFMNTFNKDFSCSWILSVFWACRKQLFFKWIYSCRMLKMFWIISDGNVKTLSYLSKQKDILKKSSKLSHVNPQWKTSFTAFVFTTRSVKIHWRSVEVLINLSVEVLITL